MIPTVLTFSGLVLCVLTGVALRGGLRSRDGMTVVGMDGMGLLLALGAVAVAMVFFGPLYGLALTLAVAIHEFGHVAAYRVAGHDDARFRLIPLMGGVAISDRPPATQADDFFITLMGPAIGLGPMVLALGLATPAFGIHPMLGQFLLVFATVTGGLNFLNMLPFFPLDGGRMVRVIAYAFWPPLALVLTTMMTAALIVAGIALQSVLLFFVALLGAQSIWSMNELSRYQTPLTRGRALVAAGAYLATAAAFFMGGYSFIMRFL